MQQIEDPDLSPSESAARQVIVEVSRSYHAGQAKFLVLFVVLACLLFALI